MKNYTIFAILTLVLSVFLLTGFQCASQEMTSAKLYIQRSDWQSAEKWLVKEVEKNPTNGEAWWLLGNTRMQMNNYKGSVEAYNASLKNSNEFTDKIHLAKKYIWSQSLNQGVNFYNQSLKASPDSSKMLIEKAIASYGLALEVNPDSAITYQNLAAAYHSQGNLDKEINTLKQALTRKQSVAVHTLLINAYLQKAQAADAKSDTQGVSENYNNALTAIIEARKTAPENAELLAAMIDIHVRLGRANEAKPYIREAIEKDSTNKVYQYDLGVLLMQTDSLTQTDSLDEAITRFENALKIDSTYEVALQNIGVAYMRVGARMKDSSQSSDAKQVTNKKYIEKFKKATEYFEQLTAVKSDNPNAWDLLASAYANANMVKEAEDALKKADALRKK
jgi:tetratricopeptide (TPR) repeat protein